MARTSLPITTGDARRIAIVYLLMGVAVAAVYALGRALGLWRPLERWFDLPLNIIMAVLLSFLITQFVFRYYILIVQRAMGMDTARMLKLLQAQNYDEALALAENAAETFAKHPTIDRWRALVFLDGGAYSYHEIMLLNCAHILLRLKRLDNAVSRYEQVLALNPHNLIAANSLSLARLARGELPAQSKPPYNPGNYADFKLRTRLRMIRFVVLLLILFPGMSLIGSIISLLLQPAMWFIGTSPTSSVAPSFQFWTLFGWTVLGILAFEGLGVWLYRWFTSNVLLFDWVRGRRYFRAGRFEQAKKALEKQLVFLHENPGADQWRWLLFLNPTTFSYREMILLELATIFLHLGDLDQALAMYKRVLEINPDNGNAADSLEFAQMARAGSESSVEVPSLV